MTSLHIQRRNLKPPRQKVKEKLPKPIFQFAISQNGQHYAVGLIDGSLILKSKQLESFEEEQDDEMKLVMNALKPNYKSTAKSYKYFYRG